MRYTFLVMLTLITLITLSTVAQQNKLNKQAAPIVAEGKQLYLSEMASWYGTDLFLSAYDNKPRVGGYFSYVVGDSARCVFFSKDDTPVALGTMTFDSTYNLKTARVDLTERPLTSYELKLYTIREAALVAMYDDTLFKRYENTNFNPIPIIHNKEKKVYVLTASTEPGYVLFGNDYLITFNHKNEIVGKKALHKSLIPIKYGQKDDEGKDVLQTGHTHLPESGDFITATDVCTLMLYGKMAGWQMHTVYSDKYMSIWYCDKNRLFVITADIYDKIEKNNNKSGKKRN